MWYGFLFDFTRFPIENGLLRPRHFTLYGLYRAWYAAYACLPERFVAVWQWVCYLKQLPVITFFIIVFTCFYCLHEKRKNRPNPS